MEKKVVCLKYSKVRDAIETCRISKVPRYIRLTTLYNEPHFFFCGFGKVQQILCQYFRTTTQYDVHLLIVNHPCEAHSLRLQPSMLWWRRCEFWTRLGSYPIPSSGSAFIVVLRLE